MVVRKVAVGGAAMVCGLAAAASLVRSRSRSSASNVATQEYKKLPDHLSARTDEAAQLLQNARAIISAAQFGTLCTNTVKGAPNCRAVTPLPPEAGFEGIRMATNPQSRKVEQIKRDDNVALTYLDANEMSYVSVTGRMSVFESEAQKKERWQPEWALFYPQGPSEGFTPLELTPARIEIVSVARGVVGPSDTWLPPALVRDSSGLWMRELKRP